MIHEHHLTWAQVQGYGKTKWVMRTKCWSHWLGLSKECLSRPIGYEVHERTAKLIRPDLKEWCLCRRLYGCDCLSVKHTHTLHPAGPKWLPKETCHPDLIRIEQHEGDHTGQLERNHMEAQGWLLSASWGCLRDAPIAAAPDHPAHHRIMRRETWYPSLCF